jgi:glycosyltransferase involved in cell wall biosynthesis
MKVVIVIGALERGGSERQIVEFVRAAHPTHADCVIICLGQEGALAPEVRSTGARVIALKAQRLYSPGALWRFACALRRERPDVVYGFLFFGYGISMPLAALVIPRACRIQARRSLPSNDVPRRRIFRPMRRLADRCCHGAVVNSTAVGRAVAGNEPIMRNRIWVVPNGVRRVAERPTNENGKLTIVCIANFIWYKGHRTLVSAVRRLPAGDWSVLLAGDGPERANIERAIVDSDLGSKVVLLGRLTDVDDLLASAGVLVLPSYSEGMPNAVIEAMAHGVPVVASAVGGVESLLGSGAGIVVPPRDDQALAVALQRLIEDADLRRRMGAKGRDIATTVLSIDAMRDGTLDAFRQICQHRQRH